MDARGVVWLFARSVHGGSAGVVVGGALCDSVVPGRGAAAGGLGWSCGVRGWGATVVVGVGVVDGDREEDGEECISSEA